MHDVKGLLNNVWFDEESKKAKGKIKAISNKQLPIAKEYNNLKWRKKRWYEYKKKN